MIVVWRVIDRCNLACPFCAYDKRLAFSRSSADPDDILRFARVLAQHQARSGDPVLLSWLGGEPLLWPPLAASTRAVRALGLKVSATTNGTVLGSRRLRRHICENYQEITVSVDGFPDFHDAMRGWNGGFAKLRSWVPQLAREARALDAPLKLRVNVVLMHQNIAAFPLVCAELATWGIHEITFNQLGGRDRPEFYPMHRLTPADVDKLEAQLPAIRDCLAQDGVILVGGEGYLARIRASAMGQRNPVEDCGPGQGFLFIDEHGRVSPCSFTTSDYAIDVRTIRTEADIAALSVRFHAMQYGSRSAQCDDCLSTQVCDKFRRPELSRSPVSMAVASRQRALL
jgi:radical SAM protein with 4Fe4S-binding SPASM domain